MSASIDHKQFAQAMMPFGVAQVFLAPSPRVNPAHRRLALAGFIALNAALWLSGALAIGALNV